MDEQQIINLVKEALNGNQQARKYITQIMQTAQQIQQVMASANQGGQQPAQQQQVQQAKFGAKLNYIKQLRGMCPEGYEMKYFSNGGKVCKTCEKKYESGGNVKQRPKTIVEQFKTEAAKCGKKLKKK